MNAGTPHEAILALLETYFEGLYQADSALLASVFHPRAQYVNTAPGDERILTLLEYQHLLDQRVSPASNGEPRQQRVISIETTANTMAFAKVQMSMLGRDYTDFLTLIREQNQWRIIAKVFHYQPTPQGD